MNLKKFEIFDAAAKNYDDTFTNSLIGLSQRERVYHWLDKIDFFNQKNNVFEINCGTGFDADFIHKKGLQITATDGSSEMIEYAKNHRNSSINFYQLKFNDIGFDEKFKNSNILFSNFGGLNCLSQKEFSDFINQVSKIQKKGDEIAWVIMPKFCFMESIYFVFKGKFKEVFRRNTNEGLVVNVEGTDVKTYYHSPTEVKNLLKGKYKILIKKPVAFFLPPSYLESIFQKRKNLYKILVFFEKIFGRISFLSNYSDHYIITAQRL